MDDIYKLEADIALYEELEAAEAVENNATLEDTEANANVAENVEAAEVAEATEDIAVIATLPEGFDVDKARAELKELNDGKAFKGINEKFVYDEAVKELAELEAEKVEKNYPDNPKYNYTITMLLFVSFGVLALLFGFWLKIEDKKKGYGLELPNIKQE